MTTMQGSVMTEPNGNGPHILTGCDVLPPMNDSTTVRKPANRSGAKGKTAGDRFKVLNAFVDWTLAKLSRATISVWLVLFRDTRDGTARTGMTDLARRAGCSRRAVVSAVKKLEELGLLNVVYRGGLRRGVSRYRVRPLKCE
jgi:hypothetical protein